MSQQTSYFNVTIVSLLTVVAGVTTAQTTRYVDDDACPAAGTGALADPFCSIQDCITASTDGDECLVNSGTYSESLNMMGRAIAVRSIAGPHLTILDGVSFSGTILTCTSGEGPSTIIEGFTFTNGSEPSPGNDGGGALFTWGASPTIRDCIFADNEASNGAAVACYDASSPRFENCLFYNNVSTGGGNDIGGAILLVTDCQADIVNCTIVNNSAEDFGGGIAIFHDSTCTVINTILWNNSVLGVFNEETQVYTNETSSATISHSCVEALTPAGQYDDGTNIDLDPLFFDAASNNFRLQGGISPCIDTGDATLVVASTDLDGNARRVDDPDSSDCPHAPGTCGASPIVDMGCYEFGGAAAVPAISQWGFVVIAMAMIATTTLLMRQRRPYLES